jgi:hypothetical protein
VRAGACAARGAVSEKLRLSAAVLVNDCAAREADSLNASASVAVVLLNAAPAVAGVTMRETSCSCLSDRGSGYRVRTLTDRLRL